MKIRQIDVKRIGSSKSRGTAVSLRFATLLSLVICIIIAASAPIENHLLPQPLSVAAPSQKKIEPEVYNAAQYQARLPLIVYLTEQPAFEIARHEQTVHLPSLRDIANRLEQMTLPFTPDDIVSEPIRAEIRELNERRESILEAMRATIYSRTQSRLQRQQRRFQQFVEEQLNGKLTAQIVLVNAHGIEIPSEMLARLAQYSAVRSICLNHPVGLELNVSAPAIGANYWWHRGAEGPGWYDIAVLDTGITFRSDNGLAPHEGRDNDKRTWIGGPPDISDQYGHGTAVAGIVASVGTQSSALRGVSPTIGKLINAKVASDANAAALEGNIMEAIEWSIHQSDAKAECINLSLKVGEIRTGYKYSESNLAKYIDFIVDIEWVPIVKSAGNRGASGLTHPADAYNGIAVGNVHTRSTIDTSDDQLRHTSSRGPLPDGRKEPEPVAPGSFITTSSRLGGFSSAIPPDPPTYPLGRDLVGTK